MPKAVIQKSLFQKPIFHTLLIAVLCLIVYSNTFKVPFLFDDLPNIVESFPVKNLNYSQNRIVGLFTFVLNYKVHGLDVAGYHAVNLSIHILNALLVYVFVLLTFRTSYLKNSRLIENPGTIALFTGLLFASHPLQTQAVTYIVQRFASLATFFYLLSLVLYIRVRLNNNSGHKFIFVYALSIISAVLAMRTKEIAFTLPLVIVLYEFIFFRDSFKRRIFYLIPFLFTMLIIPLTILDTSNLLENIASLGADRPVENSIKSDIDKPLGSIIDNIESATRDATRLSRNDYMMTQFRVIVTYIRLLSLPLNQNLDYDYPVYHSFIHPHVFLSFLFLFTIFGFGVFLLYRSMKLPPAAGTVSYKMIAFGVFWFFITLSVESSIIPILDVINEHRVYLSSVGFFLSTVTAGFVFIKKDKSPVLQTAGITFLILLTVVYSIFTYRRNTVWRSGISLWEDVVKKSPNKIRGHNNLGNAYTEAGLIDPAIEQFEMALRLKPDFHRPDYQGYYGEAHYNLARAYQQKGLADEALKHYRMAIILKPDNIDAHNNMGIVYFDKGLIDKAIEYYKKALKLDPKYINAFFNLGEAFGAKGLIDESIEYYQTFLKFRPDYAEAHYNIGMAYREKDLVKKSEEHLRMAENLRKQNK